MGAKIWVPLAVSVVLGLAAAMLTARVLHTPRGSVATDASAVVVAARDIDPGTELSAEDLTTIKYPARAVPPEAVRDPQALVGRVTASPIFKGQLACDRLLVSAGTPAGLQSLVPPGMRAITLEVNEFSGVGGMLVPGEHVDVIANIRNEETKELAARTVVQDLQVLAVGRTLGAAQDKNNPNGAAIANNATLLVTPKQAQAIQLASQGARPWLVLRGYHDSKSVTLGTTELAELRGEAPGSVLAKLLAAIAHSAASHAPTQVATTQPSVQPSIVQAVEVRKTAEVRPVRVVRFIFGGVEQKQTFPVEDPDAVMASPDTGYAIPR